MATIIYVRDDQTGQLIPFRAVQNSDGSYDAGSIILTETEEA